MTAQDRLNARLLVTDLDNTLWDWFDVWYHSFKAMLTRLVELSGVSAEQLEDEIRSVHQRRRTTEYSLLLNELPSLITAAKGQQPIDVFDEAIHELNSVRANRMALYPGVRSTLELLKKGGVPVVAYSESLAYWTEWRMRRTEIDGLIDVLYTSPDHDFPAGVKPDDIRRYPSKHYGLKLTKHRSVPAGTLKPDTVILTQIVEEFEIDPREVAYIGDSVMKDVAMAQAVGVIDLHAAYGVSQSHSGYELLRRVSHWTSDDIERERELYTKMSIVPRISLDIGFEQMLQYIDFGIE